MRLLAETSLAAACAAAARHAEEVDAQARFPIEVVQELKDARWLGALVPAIHGGGGMRLAEIGAVCHRLAENCGASGMVFAMHQIQVSCLVAHGNHEPWLAGLLQRINSEQLLLASVTSEHGTGGNIRESRCAVLEDNSPLQLEKNAPTVSYGAYADGLCITARRGVDAPPSDQVLMTVLRGEFELLQTGSWDTLGMRGTCSDGFLVRVPAGQGRVLERSFADIASTMLAVSHLLWGCVWLGIASDAVARARALLRADLRRRQTSGGSGTLTTPLLSDAVGLLQSMQAELTQGFRLVEHGTADLSPASLACLNLLKVNLSTGCLRAVMLALAICGISGYRNGGPYSLGRHLRDLASAPLMIGNDRIRDNTANLLLMQMPPLGRFEQ
jgi:acyl-CoA dehydrogenase